MLIWTTAGPKRAEKPVAKQPVEEAFAESQTEPAAVAKSDKDAACPDVFHESPAGHQAPRADAAEDADWSAAETAREKLPETTD